MLKENYVTRQEVANYLGVSLRTVDRLRSEGLIQGIRLLGVRRFSPTEIEHLVEYLKKEQKND